MTDKEHIPLRDAILAQIQILVAESERETAQFLTRCNEDVLLIALDSVDEAAFQAALRDACLVLQGRLEREGLPDLKIYQWCVQRLLNVCRHRGTSSSDSANFLRNAEIRAWATLVEKLSQWGADPASLAK